MGLNKIVYEKFKKAFENKCFTLVCEAYQTTIDEKIVELNWNENDISEELYRKIDSNSKRLTYSISVHREDFQSKNVIREKGFADKLPRVDLRMSTITSNLEFKYFFEAKNLKQNSSSLKRRYIDEGINSFLTQKYPRGCMLGYLLEGEVDKTVDGINSLLINKDKREDEIMELKEIELYNHYYESNHPKIGALKHLIFDFTQVEVK